MKIPTKLTDKNFQEIQKPVGEYSNTNEMLGELAQLTNNLHNALYRGRNMVSSEVLGILSDINTMTVKASRSYIRK